MPRCKEGTSRMKSVNCVSAFCFPIMNQKLFYKTLLSATALVGSLALNPSDLWGQQSFGGRPSAPTEWTEGTTASLRSGSSLIPLRSVTIPFNSEDLRAADAWQAQQIGAPLIVGRAVDARFSMGSDAVRYTTADGREVRLLQLSASGAQALSVAFSQCTIPEGGKLFLYDPAQQTVLGAFTRESNPSGGIFATTLIPGGNVVLHYEAPIGTPAPTIEVDHLGYMYHLESTTLALPRINPGEGASGLCQVNVNCSEGDATRKQQDAVVQILTKMGDNYAFCTGTVVNNTNEDFTPLVITAGHCLVLPKITASDADLLEWVFTFHYERPFCSNNMWIKEKSPSLVGCTKKAFMPLNGMSDGLLLQLKQPIPESYGVFYAGWNANEEVVSKAIGLHHPRGDAMKIATITQPIEHWTAKIGDDMGFKDAHWKVRFAATEHGHSVTEGGSSGSGLFNDRGQLIATLTGGAAECDKNINGMNLYGKLFYHWDKFLSKGEEHSLAKWLDPKGNGTTRELSGRYQSAPNKLKSIPIANLKAIVEEKKGAQQVRLTWDAPAEPLAGAWKIYVRAEGKTLLASLSSNMTNYTISSPTSAGGIATYEVFYGYTPEGAQEPIPFAISTVSVYLASPASVRSLQTEMKNGALELTWRKPVQRQRISQTNVADGASVKAQDFDYPTEGVALDSVFFGCRYDGYDFTPVKDARVVGLRFVPARGNKLHSYTAFIRNGQRSTVAYDGTYSLAKDDNATILMQPITESYSGGKWLTVPFARAFKPSTESMFVAGIKVVSNVGYSSDLVRFDPKEDAVLASRNVLSFDGCYWMPSSIGFPKNKGAFTFEVILDDAEENAPIDVTGTIPSGIRPAAFPKLVGYKIMRNGSEVTMLNDPNVTTYRLEGAASGDKVEVFPVYEDGRIVTALTPIIKGHSSEAPVVYPTEFTDALTIRSQEPVRSVEVYSALGVLVSSFVTPAERTFFLSSLASGVYFVRLTLEDGSVYVERVIKKI